MPYIIVMSIFACLKIPLCLANDSLWFSASLCLVRCDIRFLCVQPTNCREYHGLHSAYVNTQFSNAERQKRNICKDEKWGKWEEVLKAWNRQPRINFLLILLYVHAESLKLPDVK